MRTVRTLLSSVVYLIFVDVAHIRQGSLIFNGAILPAPVNIPDSKVHVANMGPTWGRQDPGGPHVGHMNLAIWDTLGDVGT